MTKEPIRHTGSPLGKLFKGNFFRASRFSKTSLTIFSLIFVSIGSYFLFFSNAAGSLPGDINGDNVINVKDLSLLLSSYGSNAATCTTNSIYTCDLNGDGKVGVVDLSILLSNYGKTVTPLGPVLSLNTSANTISWPAIAGATSYQGAISNGPRSDTGRTTTYTTLGNVTSWNPPLDCGKTDYYGVSDNGDGLWSATEVSITWPACQTSMIVGLNGGGWGIAGDNDMKSIVNYHRLEAGDGGEVASQGYNIGLLADLDYATDANGSYNTGGVSAINQSAWVSHTLSDYEGECGSGSTAATLCPQIEILNEPGGFWFWGSNANTQANANAYATLLQASYTAFHNQYGANSPKILGSYDGGSSSDITWGQKLYGGNPNVGNYVDGWTLHPYAGCDSTLHTGHQSLVTQAHTNTGKPIYVTEVGWSTDVGANCSQVTEQQQADDIYNFISWARSTGYVNAVYIFNYADYNNTAGSTDWWGVAGWPDPEGTHKPSWNALKCAAQNKPENC